MAGLGGGGGSGGDAGAIRAGKAYVEFGVKDNATAQLKKLESNLTVAGKQIGKAFEGTAGKTAEIAGSAGVKGLAFFGAAAALKEMAQYADAFVPALTQARKELEMIGRAAKNAAYGIDVNNKQFELMRELASSPAESMALLEKQIRYNQKLLGDANAEANATRDKGLEVTRSRGFFVDLVRDRFVDRKADAASADAEVEAAAGRAGDAMRRLEELKRARERIIDPFKDPAFVSSFRDLGESIKEALDPAIDGMGALERKAYDMNGTS